STTFCKVLIRRRLSCLWRVPKGKRDLQKRAFFLENSIHSAISLHRARPEVSDCNRWITRFQPMDHPATAVIRHVHRNATGSAGYAGVRTRAYTLQNGPIINIAKRRPTKKPA